jgi:hypothetical protein
MRNPALIFVLVLLALIPIVVWGYAAYHAALTYNVGKTHAAGLMVEILAGLAPGLVGGILMAAGAVLLGRKPLGARVMATFGLVLVILMAAMFAALEGARIGRERLAVSAAYALQHAGVLVRLWRGRRRPAV